MLLEGRRFGSLRSTVCIRAHPVWCAFLVVVGQKVSPASHWFDVPCAQVPPPGPILTVPELPEVEVLVRYLRPRLLGRTVRRVRVSRPKVLGSTPVARFGRTLRGATFTGLSRRGKYLLFRLRVRSRAAPFVLTGHLGMTGRMYVMPAHARLPRHTPVVFDLGGDSFVFEDTRYFGRLTLDGGALARLGPEPLGEEFTAERFGQTLKRSAQAIKVRLLDQSLVAGVGNIYASEALFCARISPALLARSLTQAQVRRLRVAVRRVLREAIQGGSTVPLDYPGRGERDGLFYFGRVADVPDYYTERLRVYDREGRPCVRCGALVKRLLQAGRSTFYCPRFQHR